MKKELSSNTESIWQWDIVEILIGIAIIAIPLWYGSGQLFPFTVAKSLITICLAIILGSLYLFGKVKSMEKLNWNITFIPMIFFGISITTSALIGLNPQFSFFGSLIDGTGVNLILSAIIIAMIGATMIKRNQSLLPVYLWISLGTSVVVAFGSYFQNLYPSSTGGSTFGNTSYMAAYLLINICFAVALFLRSNSRRKKVLASIFGIIILFAPTFFNRGIYTGSVKLSEVFQNPLLIAGTSNGATIALTVTSLIIIGLLLVINSNKKYIKFIGGGMVGIAVIGFLGFWTLFQTPGNKLNEFFIERKSDNRMIFWDIARQGISEKPLFGWGENNYAYVFQEKFTRKFFTKDSMVELWTNNPHNMALEIKMEQGYVGFALYISIIVITLIFAVRESLKNKEKSLILIPLSGALIGYYIQNLFIFDTPGTIFIFWILIAMIVGYSGDWREYSFSNKISGKFFAWGIRFIGITILTLLPMLVFKPWRESKAWVNYSKVPILVQSDHSPQDISHIGYGSDSAFFFFFFINQIKSDTENNESNRAIVKKMEQNLTQELVKDPYNFRIHWVLGQLYITEFSLIKPEQDSSERGEILSNATEHIDQAIEIVPENAYVYIDKVQILFFERRWDDAEKVIREIIELAPEKGFSYELADQLNDIKKKPDLIQFANEMKEQYYSEGDK